MDNELPTISKTSRRDPFAALHFRDFRFLFTGRFIWQLGEQMLNAAVVWELYARTQSALALALVGLVQVLPVILLVLPAGQIADRLNRRNVVITTQIVLAVCALGLAYISSSQGSLEIFYAILFMTGVAMAFNTPALSALVPQTIPPSYYHNAVTWNSSSWQVAAMLGPALAGFLIAGFQSTAPIYVINAITCVFFMVMLLLLRSKQLTRANGPMTLNSMFTGVSFVWNTKVILGAITLDMFAVLFGSVTALIPVYAQDILRVGPDGYGLLRAAQAIGAVLMGVVLVNMPSFTRAGRTLLIAVAGFGIVTILFGISESFLLSMILLALLGALDNISVVIRSTMMMLRVPDEVRGRIAAVNSVFVGASNELGTFESGIAAAILGPVGAVVAGGIGTLIVVATVAWRLPELRKLERI